MRNHTVAILGALLIGLGLAPARAVAGPDIVADLNTIDQSRNRSALVEYFNTKINTQNLHAAINWIRDKASLDTDPIFPLVYSDLLYRTALGFKNMGRTNEYKSLMDTAAIMYIFADATVLGDVERCVDRDAAHTDLKTIRESRTPVIIAHLKTLDMQQRQQVIDAGFLMEERIANRPPNPWPCLRSIAAYKSDAPAPETEARPAGKTPFITGGRWQKRRANALTTLRTRLQESLFQNYRNQ